MKQLFFVFVAGLTMAACSQKSDVTPMPDAGAAVAGTYPLTFVEGDSAGAVLYQYTLPYAVSSFTLAGSLTARRDSASAVFVTQTIKATGYADQTSVIGEISLRPTGTGSMYDMYLSNHKIGTADGQTITIDDAGTDPTTGASYRNRITAHK